MTYVPQSCKLFGVGEMGWGEYGNAVLSLQLLSQCNIILKLKVYLQRQGNSIWNNLKDIVFIDMLRVEYRCVACNHFCI